MGRAVEDWVAGAYRSIDTIYLTRPTIKQLYFDLFPAEYIAVYLYY